MQIALEDWKNGWFGVDVALAPHEIDRLIELLRLIKTNPEQHFHLSSDCAGSGGIGQITFLMEAENSPGNAALSGPALAPGTEVGGGGA